MSKPIFILAGQSNAAAMSGEVRESLDARFGKDGYVLIEAHFAGAPIARVAHDRDDWATDSELPAQLLNSVQQALVQHPDSYCGGMIWVQGEADTWNISKTEIYAERVQKLFDQLSTDIAALGGEAAESFANMRVVVSQLADAAPASERKNWDPIIEQQAKLAAFYDDISIIDPDLVARATETTESEMFRDNLHYSDAFALTLADALVERVIAMSQSNVVLSNAPQAYAQEAEFTTFLRGSTNDENLIGTSGDDRLKGKGGQDYFDGGAGNDFITGGSSTDSMSGGAGQDRLSGYRGDDLLNGGAGADAIYAGQGNDIAVGGEGQDILRGNHGDDFVFGGAGRDDVRGGVGHDLVTGDEGNDYLFGDHGRDIIIGGAGNDVLNGGSGRGVGDGFNDVFVFETNGNEGRDYDRIRDFETGLDMIDVTAYELANAKLITNTFVQTSHGLRFDLPDGDRVLLQGLSLDDATQVDFLI